MTDFEPLIPKHVGYRNLKSFQLAQLVYDLTLRFCNLYIDKRSRTHDQMVLAHLAAKRRSLDSKSRLLSSGPPACFTGWSHHAPGPSASSSSTLTSILV